jgi:hypothetical protein
VEEPSRYALLSGGDVTLRASDRDDTTLNEQTRVELSIIGSDEPRLTLRVPQRDAMQILGHARISVTLEIYTDSDSDSQRDALTRMSDRLFGRAGT